MSYDGKWGREIREQVLRERSTLKRSDLLRLRGIATQAQAVIPGPWRLTEANFIVHGYLDNDPETGKVVAEVDCYDEHGEEKTAYLAAFDPATVLQLLDMAKVS